MYRGCRFEGEIKGLSLTPYKSNRVRGPGGAFSRFSLRQKARRKLPPTTSLRLVSPTCQTPHRRSVHDCLLPTIGAASSSATTGSRSVPPWCRSPLPSFPTEALPRPDPRQICPTPPAVTRSRGPATRLRVLVPL
ncbi:hypothetical protein EUGRSUZ_L03488 [Eucalyptus grandis]|uniref:Uncharacterized protein n=1 Tax=Eucalyptus grandis TaxID=71139 RepID=A0AAD9WI71_EUCGR|nr:hypothetical protein EUGRSUZ_L03488 [Eucalyptus grandis]